jgi:hypothetical protein
MVLDLSVKAKVDALSTELEIIYFINCLYWRKGEATSTVARGEYERRNQRLNEIRTELAQLLSF